MEWEHPWHTRGVRCFPALAHVAVTVSDLDRSIEWYTALLDEPPVIVTRSDGFRWAAWVTFGLHEHETKVHGEFDARRVGLDHVAFACAGRADLVVQRQRCEDLGVRHAEIVDEFYGSGLAVWDPDGIALEFFAPPEARRA